MLYCKCGAYLLWERDHWVCMDCGASPWRCECAGHTQRLEASGIESAIAENQMAGNSEKTLLEKAKQKYRELLAGEENDSPKSQ